MKLCNKKVCFANSALTFLHRFAYKIRLHSCVKKGYSITIDRYRLELILSQYFKVETGTIFYIFLVNKMYRFNINRIINWILIRIVWHSHYALTLLYPLSEITAYYETEYEIRGRGKIYESRTQPLDTLRYPLHSVSFSSVHIWAYEIFLVAILQYSGLPYLW